MVFGFVCHTHAKATSVLSNGCHVVFGKRSKDSLGSRQQDSHFFQNMPTLAFNKRKEPAVIEVFG
jgi:hypothetical protein